MRLAIAPEISRIKITKRSIDEPLSPFHRRLREVVGTESQNAFAARAGISQSAFNRILHGGSPSLDSLIGIANAANVTVGWLAAGETVTASKADDVLIQRLAFRASAGAGGPLVLDEEGDRVPFPPGILQELRMRPEHARLLAAESDSMRPTIEGGDLLLLDIRRTEIVEGKIYVFAVGDTVFVKRLRRPGSRLLMRSDNRELYPDEEEVPTADPVRIIGRVVWVGRRL